MTCVVARADYVRQARQIDAKRPPQIEERERVRASDEAEGTYATRLLHGDPTAPLPGVYHDDALTINAKRRLLVMGKVALDPEPPAEMSKSIALGLRDRIRRPDGDPDKVTNRIPLIEAFNAGNLTRADYELLEKQVAESRTSDGATLANSRHAFIE